MNRSEKELITVSAKGDIEAYERLIETYEKKVFSLIYAAVGDRPEASRITQDIFIKVYMDLKTDEKGTGLTQLVYGTTRKALMARCKNMKCDNLFTAKLNIISWKV